MSKYRSRRVRADGYTFDSEAEYARYCALRVAEKAGEISDLQVHPTFDLHCITGQRICRYEADFAYTEDGQRVVEDVKGVRTPVYRLKKRWVEAEYGITVTEIPARSTKKKSCV